MGRVGAGETTSIGQGILLASYPVSFLRAEGAVFWAGSSTTREGSVRRQTRPTFLVYFSRGHQTGCDLYVFRGRVHYGWEGTRCRGSDGVRWGGWSNAFNCCKYLYRTL